MTEVTKQDIEEMVNKNNRIFTNGVIAGVLVTIGGLIAGVLINEILPW